MNSLISRISLESGAFYFKIGHQNYSIEYSFMAKNKKKKKILFRSTKT